MKKAYDVLVVGPVSLDHNIDYLGNERKELGGAPRRTTAHTQLETVESKS